MDYNQITSFLDKFKDVLFQKQQNHQLIVDIIEKHIKIPINKELIKIKGNTIYINGSPILKSEIMIYKSKILEDLSTANLKQIFTDIK